MQPPEIFGYDRAITVFSPNGRLYQVEYAREAVKRGTLSIGIVYKGGVCLVVDKNITDPLMVPESFEKLYQIDDHAGAATSGLVADGRRLIERARIEAQIYRITYDEIIPVDLLVKKICDYKQMYTQIGGLRPFGTALLLAGVDNKPKLFETDPSGSFWEYLATAIGEKSSVAKEYFRKNYTMDVDEREAIKLCLEALSQASEIELTERNVEIAVVREEDKRFRKLTQKEVKAYLKKV